MNNHDIVSNAWPASGSIRHRAWNVVVPLKHAWVTGGGRGAFHGRGGKALIVSGMVSTPIPNELASCASLLEIAHSPGGTSHIGHARRGGRGEAIQFVQTCRRACAVWRFWPGLE